MKKSKVYKVYLIYFISMAIFCGLRIASSFGLFNFLHPDIADIVYTVIIQVGLMLLLPMSLYTLFFKSKEGFISTFKDTHLSHGVSLKVLGLSFGLGVLAFFINIAV